jgi:hypothetical protein
MSIYLDKRDHKLGIQRQACPRCQRRMHHLCLRRTYLGQSTGTDSPVWECCCGGQPSTQTTYKGAGADKPVKRPSAGPLSRKLEKAIKDYKTADALAIARKYVPDVKSQPTKQFSSKEIREVMERHRRPPPPDDVTAIMSSYLHPPKKRRPTHIDTDLDKDQ